MSTLASEIFNSIDAAAFSQASLWAKYLWDQCSSALTELDVLMPRLSLAPLAKDPDILESLETILTINQLAGIENVLGEKLRARVHVVGTLCVCDRRERC